MRRIYLALALIGAVAFTGCGKTSTSNTGGTRGVAESTYKIFVQNGQNGNTSLAIRGAFVTSTPAGIDCGVAPHGACEAEFGVAQSVSLTVTVIDPAVHFYGFAGDCAGMTCTLDGTTQGGADKYVLAQIGLPENQAAHSDWSPASVHGKEFWDWRNGLSPFACTGCHNSNLQGLGSAVSCRDCHGSSNRTVQAEDCANCHGVGTYGSAPNEHLLADQLGVVVSNVAAAVNGSDVVLTYNVKVNGANRDDFLRKASEVRDHNEDAWWRYDGPTQAGARTKLAPFVRATATTPASSPSFTIESLGAGTGNYRATLLGYAASAAAGNAYMISAMAGTSGFGTTATVVAWYGARTHDVISDQACINCHGQLVWRDAAHDVTFPQGVGPCIVCHSRTGAQDPRLPGAGSGLMGIVHGIHNSANMPDDVYTFTWTNGNKFNFTKGFPSYMDNCSTCHSTTAELAAVAGAPVSYALCISCHDDFSEFAPADHLGFTTTQSCSPCHDGQTVSTHHNGLVTERAGLIWDGADQSVVLAPTVVMEITGISVSGASVVVTWTAKDTTNGNALWNPCNTNFATGPVFLGYTSPLNRTEGCTNTTGGCNSNFSILRAYGQGDDWVNEGLTGATSPGQPRSVNLTATNTTCSGANVATSTIPVHTWDAGFATPSKGIAAIQGKPQIRFAPNGNIIWVRAQTPTREFLVANGSAPASNRREIVDVNKCNACHLGTLYQHGGTRVDKIELCVMCHDPASSEQQNRIAMGVTPAEAYDGLPGQTYDMRYMVHAIHAAGENGRQLMFYRSNGIYFFGSLATVESLPNWPLNGTADQCISCVDVEDGPLTYCKVYGSSATGEKPVANPDGSCGTPVASTDGTWRPHRVVEVHYPRALNDCSACHVDSTPDLPDPTQAVAVTLDAGVAPWNNGHDDVLMGASAASCFSCHQAAGGQQAILRDHAYGFGFEPQVFPGGRGDLLVPAP